MTRVVLFLLDGCRPDALDAAGTPVFQSLCRRGAWTLHARTVMPSITLPCHMSLFHAVPPVVHGVMTNDWSAPSAQVPSLVTVLSDLGYGTAAFYTWEQLRDLAPPGTLDVSFYRRYSEDGFAEVVGMAADTISSTLPTFSFVYLEAADALGHRYGWMSPEYLEAVRQSDAAVGQVLEALGGVGSLGDTVFVVMADHGGHEHGHGTDLPEDMTIPFVICGPGVRTDYEIKANVSILDIAPTILNCLGLSAPESWAGRTLEEIFEIAGYASASMK